MIAVLVITAALMVVLLWADRRARYYASPIILDAEADCDDARDGAEASCTSDDYNSSSAASDQR